MAIIAVENVTKTYRRRRGARALVGTGGLGDVLRKRRMETFSALRDVSFTVAQGESLGLIGANGSGKSTLLKIIAGVTVPTSGHVTVAGRVASLLELGAGFHPMLTGRENIYLNAGLLGMRHAQVDTIIDDIVAFSGIPEFIDNPVDTYSSGMYVRVAFAVAAHVDPDVFLIDEVLAVGDEEFQRKCRTRIGELKECGKTIVFVSHDLGIVNTLCDRVVLLSKGEMIARDTPQRTIDFYLRQVGREAGIHTMREGTIEVILSNGRISLFVDQVEITSPSGLQMVFESMGQWHASSMADWRIVAREETRCVAEGVMPRLPVTLHWELRLDSAKLEWNVSFECTRACPIDSFDLNLTWPQGYTHWSYGDSDGAFLQLLPHDLQWTPIAPPRPGHLDVALFAAATGLPPVHIVSQPRDYTLQVQLANSDYIASNRIVQTGARIPDTHNPVAAGVHGAMSLVIDLSMTPAELRATLDARKLKRQIDIGSLCFVFDQGCVTIAHDGRTITDSVHVHTQFLAGHLWHMSQFLLWDDVQKVDGRIRVQGASRRMPLRQVWELWPVDNGVGLRVMAVADSPVEIQEYNVSVAVVPQYEQWKTDHESGTFPAFSAGDEEWRHVNHDFAPSNAASMSGPGLPAVVLQSTGSLPDPRMTIINTGYSQQVRVAQALYVPEQGGVFGLDPTPVLWFDGVIRLVE